MACMVNACNRSLTGGCYHSFRHEQGVRRAFSHTYQVHDKCKSSTQAGYAAGSSVAEHHSPCLSCSTADVMTSATVPRAPTTTGTLMPSIPAPMNLTVRFSFFWLGVLGGGTYVPGYLSVPASNALGGRGKDKRRDVNCSESCPCVSLGAQNSAGLYGFTDLQHGTSESKQQAVSACMHNYRIPMPHATSGPACTLVQINVDAASSCCED